MPYVNVGKENSGSIDLYYEDHGSGQPVVLIHGWPLSSAAWEKQMAALVSAGHRVIAYDRRGFGASSKPMGAYDYDTLAEDLHRLLSKLGLQQATLVGFSMGGGEVARYLARHGSDRVSGAVFIGAITPFLLKTADNPGGVDGSVFEGIKQAILSDRPAFLAQFLSNFFNVDALGGKMISDQAVQASWNIAVGASPKATLDCVSAWLEDFRKDLERVQVPALVIHGNADRIVPFAASGQRMPAIVENARLVVVEGGPHGLTWTHADTINRELLAFAGHEKSAQRAA